MSRLIDIYSPKGAESYPMTLDQLSVGTGDNVTKGQVLAVLTGPDKTHRIGAPFDGTVTALNVEAGVRLGMRSPLLRMSVAEGEAPASSTNAAARDETATTTRQDQGSAKPSSAPESPAAAPQAAQPPASGSPEKRSLLQRAGLYGVAAAALWGLWQVTPNTRFVIMNPNAGFSLSFGAYQDVRRMGLQLNSLAEQVAVWVETVSGGTSRQPLQLTCEGFPEEKERVNAWGMLMIDTQTSEFKTRIQVDVDFSANQACLRGAWPDDWIGIMMIQPKNNECYAFTESGSVIGIDRKQTAQIKHETKNGYETVVYRVGDMTIDTGSMTAVYADEAFAGDKLYSGQYHKMQCRQR